MQIEMLILRVLQKIECKKIYRFSIKKHILILIAAIPFSKTVTSPDKSALPIHMHTFPFSPSISHQNTKMFMHILWMWPPCAVLVNMDSVCLVTPCKRLQN